MVETYDARRRGRAAPARRLPSVAPGPSLAELSAGAQPTAEQMGSRVDLPEGIREKMESSFGADFSNVKLFESQTVADAGAQAVTQGTNIAFAPGKLDLTSTSGQALLGHELSHVVSQARGESAGSGFLKDASLEAQADRQGMMAARGESVYAGPVSPLSAGASAVSAAGPMQAKKSDTDVAEKNLRKMNRQRQESSDAYYEARERYAMKSGRYSSFFNEDGDAGQYLKMSMGSVNKKKQDQLMKAMVKRARQGDKHDKMLNDFILNDFIKSAKKGSLNKGLLNEDFQTRAKAMGKNGFQMEKRAAAARYVRQHGLEKQVPKELRHMVQCSIDEDYDRRAAMVDVGDMYDREELAHDEQTRNYRRARKYSDRSNPIGLFSDFELDKAEDDHSSIMDLIL